MRSRCAAFVALFLRILEMEMIIFEGEYPKLHNQNTAKLVAAEKITINQSKHHELLEYDTKRTDGTYYKIDDGDYIQLIFIGDKYIPFCTLRRAYPEYKLNYYKKLIGKTIKIVITNNCRK